MRELHWRLLGALSSMACSVYPLEMTEGRNLLTIRTLQAIRENTSDPTVLGELLYQIHQSKYDLRPACAACEKDSYHEEDFQFESALAGTKPLAEERRCLLDALLHCGIQPGDRLAIPLLYKALRLLYNKASPELLKQTTSLLRAHAK